MSNLIYFRRIASNEFDKQVHIHVAMDNTLILDEIRSFISEKFFSNNKKSFLGKACQITSQIPSLLKKSNDVQNSWKPLVIIIPLRLGLNDVNSEYVDQIKVNQLNSKF
jgi:hypothetical protein